MAPSAPLAPSSSPKPLELPGSASWIPGVTPSRSTSKVPTNAPTNLKIFASPATPSSHGDSLKGTLHYPRRSHTATSPRETGPFAALSPAADIVITHGPPHGILDRTVEGRAGCEALFAAVAHARPALHCFGHIHEGWGARKVGWKAGGPWRSHFTAIDGERSESVASLRFRPGKGEEYGFARVRGEGEGENASDQETLFVNAALQGSEEGKNQLPWVVELEVAASSEGDAEGDHMKVERKGREQGEKRSRTDEDEEEQERPSKRGAT